MMSDSRDDSTSCLKIEDLGISIPKKFIAQPDLYLEYIGEGHFSKVYAYSDTEKKVKCAIKLMKDCKVTLETFQKEIDIHRKFNNPHIVRYFGGHCCDCTSKMCIIMEYMENKSLCDNLEELFHEKSKCKSANGQVPPPILRTVKSLRYIEHILSGLVYLHNLPTPVVHRDLRASNILLDANDNAKLSDFGVSMTKPENTHEDLKRSYVGNFLWYAPEIFQNKYLGCCEDIWSLGIVILEMVFYQPSFFKQYYLKSPNKLEAYNQLKKIHEDGSFNDLILRPDLKKIKSRDTRTLVKECLVRHAPDRKNSSELLCLVKQIRSNLKPSNEFLI